LKHREAEGWHLGSLGLAYAALSDARRAIESSQPYQTLLDPPPEDPRVAHGMKNKTPNILDAWRLRSRG